LDIINAPTTTGAAMTALGPTILKLSTILIASTINSKTENLATSVRLSYPNKSSHCQAKL